MKGLAAIINGLKNKGNMSNNKTKIVPKPKPSLTNKTWTYVSIAGALVAMIYAGLSQQNQSGFNLQKSDSRIESTSLPIDSAAPKVDTPILDNRQDPSH